MKSLSQQWADDRAGNNGQEGCEFEDAVAPGEQLVRQELGQQAVFGGAEEGRLRTGQENHRKCHARITLREGVHGEKHGANLEDLGGYGHVSFAKTVGQESAGHRKQQERERKEIANDKNQEIFLRIRRMGAQD